MPYAIMRCKKLATLGTVASALQHCYRDRDTPNADANRTPDNVHCVARSTDEAMGKLRDLLPDKRRKDAVLAVEYVMTASPEWWATASQAQQQAFFSQARTWLANKYGEDRIVAATVHLDEATPHLSAFVVPLTQDGRLAAKDFIGGRDKMRADQTSFAEAMRPLGLERGIEGSRATHQRVQSHYAALQKAPTHAKITPEDVQPRVLRKGWLTDSVEPPAAVAQRLTMAMQGAYAPAVEKAATAAQERRRADEMARTARERGEQLEAARSALNKLKAHVIDGLTQEQVAKVIGLAASMRQANLDHAKEKQRERQQDRGPDRGR